MASDSRAQSHDIVIVCKDRRQLRLSDVTTFEVSEKYAGIWISFSGSPFRSFVPASSIVYIGEKEPVEERGYD